MRVRRIAGTVAMAVLGAATGVHAATGGDGVLSADGVTAAVSAAGAMLSNAAASRSWSFDGASVTTTELRGPTGANWVRPGADFTLSLNGVPTSSTSGWSLIDVRPEQPPPLPDRPASASGAALLF